MNLLGDVFNGNEGDIYTQIELNKHTDGTFDARIYTSKVTNADFTTETQLIGQIFR